MSNSIFELGLTPPPGVAFVQWGDGTIRIRYSTKDVVPIRKMLLQLARSLTEQAITKLREEREAEIAKQRMPLTRLELITQDMRALEGERTNIEKENSELEQFEHAIEESLRTVAETPSTDPTVIVGRVTIDPED